MIAVPQALLENPHVKVRFKDGINCILEKTAYEDNPDNGRYVSAHTLTIVHSGQLQVNEHNKISIVNPGQMIILPIGLYFISDIIVKDSLQATIICFEDDLAKSLFDNSVVQDKNKSTLKSEIVHTPKVVKIFLNQLSELYPEGHGSALTKHKITELLYLLGKSEVSEVLKATLHASVLRSRSGVKSFMESNFDKPLQIDDYAHLTGRSISTFHRDFKRQFGQAPKSWLTKKRLQRSKEILLREKEIKVSQLSLQSGYDNVSHFIKIFKNHFGESPKQYQISHRSEMIL